MVRPLLKRSMLAIEGDAISVKGVLICGARGAPKPSDDNTARTTDRSWEQELQSLEAALRDAAPLRTNEQPLYVLWHYPPFDVCGRPTTVVERLETARVTACIYGHMHQLGQWSTAVQDVRSGVKYACVATDAIGFRPL